MPSPEREGGTPPAEAKSDVKLNQCLPSQEHCFFVVAGYNSPIMMSRPHYYTLQNRRNWWWLPKEVART